jgi:TetR/AcrR family transcriptional regulator, cholesterol catabolism regulator
MEESKKPSSKRIGAISKAGAELFATKGFVETSMHDVATAAKLSKGGIYHYFSCKTELLDFIINSFIDLVLDGLEEEIGKETNDADKIKALIFRHVRLYPQNMYKAKVLISEAHNLPRKLRKKILVKEKEYYRVITEVLSSYLGASVDKDHLTTITFSLLGMCNWIYRWYNPKAAISWEQLSQTIFDIFMSGISGLKGNGKIGS